MYDWIETPDGTFINLTRVVAVENDGEDSIRVHSDDTPKVYSGGRFFWGADAEFIKAELRLRRVNRTQLGD